jgi:hypothetical protein
MAFSLFIEGVIEGFFDEGFLGLVDGRESDHFFDQDIVVALNLGLSF